MSTIGAPSRNETGLLAPQPGVQKKAQLDQSDFLKLMTTQLKNQDPTKPMDNAQFLGQIAQFSTVSGIQALQQSFATLASSMQSAQSLQASQLVGHGVLVPTNRLQLDGSEIIAAVELPASGPVSIDVLDASGQIVHRIDMGAQPEGLAHLRWDGRGASGALLPDGAYTLRAQLTQAHGGQALSTFVVDRVGSVSVAPEGVTLHLAHQGPTALSTVRQIF